MSFRSIFTKTLRDQRLPVLAWGVAAAITVLAGAVGWAEAYPTAASREALARSVAGGLSVAELMYGEPHGIEELGGFIEWRTLGVAPVVFGLFLVIAATGATRGAEESGRIETVLATPRTRWRVFGQQSAALCGAQTAVLALVGLGLLAAGPASGEGLLSPLRIAGALLNAGLGAAMFGALALLTSQLIASRRAAGLAAAAIMFAAHYWNGLGLVEPSLEPLRPLSPLFLYSQSSPLATGHMNWPAIAAMAAISLLLAALAAFFFATRDLFSAWRPRQSYRAPASGGGRARAAGPARALPFRNAFARGLRDNASTTFAWAGGLAILTVLLTAIAPSMLEAFSDQAGSEISRRLQEAGLLTERGIVSFALFSFLPVFVALCAVTLVASWAREETAGRLEIELACPPPRPVVFLQRLAAAVALLTLLLAVIGTTFAVTAWLATVAIPARAKAEAVGAMVPFAAVVVAFGFAAAAWRPGIAAGVAGGAVGVSFFLGLLLPLFDLPEAALDVSIFHLYGEPLMDGLDLPRLGAMTVLAAVFATAGAIQFGRRDVTR